MFVPPTIKLARFAKVRYLGVDQEVEGDNNEQEDMHKQTVEAVAQMQQELVAITGTAFIVFVFGGVVPGLTIVAPCGIWAHLCATCICIMQQVSLGQKLACNVLVHFPMRTAHHTIRLAMWVVNLFTMLDMGFEVGPVLFYVAFCIAEVAISYKFSVRPLKRKVEVEVLWSVQKQDKDAVGRHVHAQIDDVRTVQTDDFEMKLGPASEKMTKEEITFSH